jgi:antibiotic biosynthesis monooxygenase (ABM) superfamily enzyme
MTILKVCIFVDFNSIFYQHLQIIDVCIFKLIKCIKICAMCYFIIVCKNHMMSFIVLHKKQQYMFFSPVLLVHE